MKKHYCWSKNKKRYTDLYEFIKQNDGISIRGIANHFNTHYATVIRWLTSLESIGLLLYEDGAKIFEFNPDRL